MVTPACLFLLLKPGRAEEGERKEGSESPRAVKKTIWDSRSVPMASMTAWMATELLPTASTRRSTAAVLLKRRVM